MKQRLICLSALMPLAFLLGGCPPQAPVGEDMVVQVTASATVTSGEAPLPVTFSASNASSPNGGPFMYDWDFADGRADDGEQATNTFTQPGLYVVRVTVTDSAGETGIATVDIRVRGVGVTAAISATPESGPSPLLVRFDGSNSSAPDDSIRDYFWDFGDGTTSQEEAPIHQYTSTGNFMVTLRVVTGGGVEDTTTLTIRVDSNTAALLFENGDRATLPVSNAPADPLTQLTIEGWFKADATGGTLLTLGGTGLAIVLDPANDTLRLTLNGESTDLTVQNLAGNWRHVAVSYNSEQIGATVYVDGESVGTAAVPMTPEIPVNSIVIGGTYAGTASEVRLWTAALSQATIDARRLQRVNGTEASLLAYWRLDEGGGQELLDFVVANLGVRGTNTSAEASDPDWTTDSPPIGG